MWQLVNSCNQYHLHYNTDADLDLLFEHDPLHERPVPWPDNTYPLIVTWGNVRALYLTPEDYRDLFAVCIRILNIIRWEEDMGGPEPCVKINNVYGQSIARYQDWRISVRRNAGIYVHERAVPGFARFLRNSTPFVKLSELDR